MAGSVRQYGTDESGEGHSDGISGRQGVRVGIKKNRDGNSDRRINTAIYALRTLQIGLKINDLEEIEEGFVMDLIIESNNDYAEKDGPKTRQATQQDFDRW